jgi:hypothetical protein
MDILKNGKEKDKAYISYRMIDIDKKRHFNKKDFQDFMTDFLKSWSSITNTVICIFSLIQQTIFKKEPNNMWIQYLLKYYKSKEIKMSTFHIIISIFIRITNSFQHLILLQEVLQIFSLQKQQLKNKRNFKKISIIFMSH